MKTSAEIGQIATALSLAQGKMKNPEKNRTVTTPKYSYNYADLPITFDAARAALAENKISHTFGVDQGICIYRLMHSSGEWIESSLPLPSGPDIKTLAGNLSYIRRYLFTALVGLAADDDVDAGEGYTSPREPERAQPKAPPLPVTAPKPVERPNDAQIALMFRIALTQGVDTDGMKALIKTEFRKDSTRDLTLLEYQQLMRKFENKPAATLGKVVVPPVEYSSGREPGSDDEEDLKF